MIPPFTQFPKIPRLVRDMVVTEKIDGTNAQLEIVEHGPSDDEAYKGVIAYNVGMTLRMYAGSRNRRITPESDNQGFARWAQANALDLFQLGPGVHFGEWWGQGIQRGYGLTEKRFSLFNVGRWDKPYQARGEGHESAFPKCCHVVPVIGKYTFDTTYVNGILSGLKAFGSFAAPGFMKPEGVVVFHTASGQLFKQLIEDDSQPKGLALAHAA